MAINKNFVVKNGLEVADSLIYADGFCSHVISEFERICDKGYCGNRQDSENIGKGQYKDNIYDNRQYLGFPELS